VTVRWDQTAFADWNDPNNWRYPDGRVPTGLPHCGDKVVFLFTVPGEPAGDDARRHEDDVTVYIVPRPQEDRP
jgi:hypothetical protein